MNNTYIQGFGISGYRSFGPELQVIGPFKKLNIIIGQNNSGKSNILRFIQDHYRDTVEAISKEKPLKFNQLDLHIQSDSRLIKRGFAVCLEIENLDLDALQKVFPKRFAAFEQLLNSPLLRRTDDAIWIPLTAENENSPYVVPEDFVTQMIQSQILEDFNWQILWQNLSQQTGASLKHWVPDFLIKLAKRYLTQARVSTIPAFRQIQGSGQESGSAGLGGVGLINKLAELQNPDHLEQEKRRQFENVNIFLQKVIGNSNARLEVPFQRDKINVHMDNKTLPLDSLGTGIHEVIILAAAASIVTKQVLCIEEPEVHLHPVLQKKLVRYLNEKTDNQYFISTHSAHILDTPGAAVFHVRNMGDGSEIERAVTDRTKSYIIRDLGYKASDLLQANCIVWVEGPSDMIYLRKWIGLFDESLIEGLHYSIMFYGGRLLSHLSGSEEVTDFIRLRNLNRRTVIVMDSDFKSSHDRINATKKRIRDEFNDEDGFAWISKGKEIENYVDHETMLLAAKAVYPTVNRLERSGDFDDRLRFVDGNKKLLQAKVDKIKIAHSVVSFSQKLNVLDLSKQLKRLVKFIRDSNTQEITFLD